MCLQSSHNQPEDTARNLSSKFLEKPGPGWPCLRLGGTEKSDLTRTTQGRRQRCMCHSPTTTADTVFCTEMGCLKHPLPSVTCCVLLPDGWLAWDSTESEICVSNHLKKKWKQKARAQHGGPVISPLQLLILGEKGQSFESTIVSVQEQEGTFKLGHTCARCFLLKYTWAAFAFPGSYFRGSNGLPFQPKSPQV